MKKYYFSIASILFLLIGLASCSNEETKTENQVASRQSLPPVSIPTQVQIGTQIWMTRNLDVTHYRNGDPIILLNGPGGQTDHVCKDYNNDPAMGAIYGKLYDRAAISRGLAPVGWHIPSNAEWTILENYLGGQNVAGGKIKSTTLWQSPNTAASNSSGFKALPGGQVDRAAGPGLQITFSNIGSVARWWTSTEVSVNGNFYTRNVLYNSGVLNTQIFDSRGLASVRCIKD
ncbi:fibrobacter succinogenes major paralogous domain-containing protein [Flavobacterium sp.]|uniref:fibrobacter succinogenes major paralogous domain-containing protein n=1 Tax=Flavobacterium sp. TaxID=239 RepID=UPI00286B867D|nr:fibrobacter succinogenes major paralogous domain-containing protein [Flavobacterium sp.]